MKYRILAIIAAVLSISTTYRSADAGVEAEWPQTRAISIVSYPPGASIWLKAGRDYQPKGSQTPEKVELQFYGEADTKVLRISKFGYLRQTVQVRPSEQEVHVNLVPLPARAFFEATGTDLANLNAEVRREFEQRFVKTEDPFRQIYFEIQDLFIGRKANDLLALFVTIDGGSFPELRKQRLGVRTPKAVRERKIAEAFLRAGGSIIINHFKEALGKFTGVQEVVIICPYSTTEAELTTDYMRYLASVTHTQISPSYELVTTTWAVSEDTTVRDTRSNGVLTLAVALDKLPTTQDREKMTEAILAVCVAKDIHSRAEDPP